MKLFLTGLVLFLFSLFLFSIFVDEAGSTLKKVTRFFRYSTVLGFALMFIGLIVEIWT